MSTHTSTTLRNSIAYAPSEHEVNTLSAVKGFIKNRKYKEPFTVDVHLMMLSAIKTKMSFMYLAEQSSGLRNWELHQKVREIGLTMSKLSSIKKNILSRIGADLINRNV